MGYALKECDAFVARFELLSVSIYPLVTVTRAGRRHGDVLVIG